MTESNQAAKPTVVVVGGGYGGIAVAKALDETSDVVLDRAEGRLHAQHRRSSGAGGSLLAPEDLPALRPGCSPTAAWSETVPSWSIRTGW